MAVTTTWNVCMSLDELPVLGSSTIVPSVSVVIDWLPLVSMDDEMPFLELTLLESACALLS